MNRRKFLAGLLAAPVIAPKVAEGFPLRITIDGQQLTETVMSEVMQAKAALPWIASGQIVIHDTKDLERLAANWRKLR